MSKKLFSISLIALSLSGLAVPAFAADVSVNGTSKSVKVFYGDLQISSKAGADTLYRRIVAAARTVCSPSPSPREVGPSADYSACMTGAVNRAVAQVGSPLLAQVVASNAAS